MSQGRRPPAFQEYASTMLASIPFRVASLEARGLLYTLRLELWENERLPADPETLARLLGLSPADIARLLPSVMPFLLTVDGFLTCPELDAYRDELSERRERQSQGGKRGSAVTNRKRKTTVSRMGKGDSSTSPSNPQVPRRVPGESLVKTSTEKQSPNQSLKQGFVPDAFVTEYESAECCSETSYRNASGK